MSHHADQFDPEMNEVLKQYMGSEGNKAREDLLKRFEERGEKLGATGEFPEGKLTEMDEGEIRMAVFRKDGKVVLDFGSQVTWVGMNPNQAIELGNLLIKHGRKAQKGGQDDEG